MNGTTPSIVPYEYETNASKKKLRKDNAVSVIKALEKHPNISFVQLKKVLSKRYGEIAATMAVQDAEFLLRQMKLANIASQEQAMYRSR